jgi:hypothetical protein
MTNTVGRGYMKLSNHAACKIKAKGERGRELQIRRLGGEHTVAEPSNFSVVRKSDEARSGAEIMRLLCQRVTHIYYTDI